MKTRPASKSKVAIYWEKANRFLDGARAAFAKDAWDAATSAAVHAGINALDALCIEELGRRAAEWHDAGSLLDQADRLPADFRLRIHRRLEALLGAKHLSEYEDRLCSEPDASNAVTHATRMLAEIRPRLRSLG